MGLCRRTEGLDFTVDVVVEAQRRRHHGGTQGDVAGSEVLNLAQDLGTERDGRRNPKRLQTQPFYAGSEPG